MRRLFIRYINGIHIIWLRSASSNTQVIRTTAHRARERRRLWFPGSGSLVWPCTNSAFAWLGRGYKWLVRINFFRLYALVICDHAPAQRNVEDSDFVSAVPHSNHHTVGTASWQNHDSSPTQSVIILLCHVCLGLSNPYISSAMWRQCKSKNTTHLPGHGYPRLAQGVGWSSGYKWQVHYL